jgi:hypothetical protein
MGNKPSGELDESDESIKKDFALHQKQAKQLNPQSQNQSQRKESTTQQQDENKPTQNDQPQQESPQVVPSDSQLEPEGAQPQEIPQPGSLVTSTNPLHASNRKVGLDDFDLMSVIGKGSFGKVFSVRKKDTGKVYAMKVLKKEEILRKKQVAHTQVCFILFLFKIFVFFCFFLYIYFFVPPPSFNLTPHLSNSLFPLPHRQNVEFSKTSTIPSLSPSDLPSKHQKNSTLS